jgi:hypothetical protein
MFLPPKSFLANRANIGSDIIMDFNMTSPVFTLKENLTTDYTRIIGLRYRFLFVSPLMLF